MNIKRFAIAVILLVVCLPGSVFAVDGDESLAFLRGVAVNSNKLLTPSVFGLASAMTMGSYNGFLAGAAANTGRSSSGTGSPQFDASAAAGIGFGDAQKSFGLDTYLGIISVNPVGESGGFGVGEDGNISVKLGKTFFTDSFDSISFAVGVNNIVAWGVATHIDDNVYGVATFGSAVTLGGQTFPVSATFGAGSKQKSNVEFGMFGGLGLGLNSYLDLSAGYNASRWLAGLNFRFSKLENPILRQLIVQVGVDDVFDNNHNRREVFIVAMPFSL